MKTLIKSLFISKDLSDLSVLPAFCQDKSIELVAQSFISFEALPFESPLSPSVIFFSSIRAAEFYLAQASLPINCEIACIGSKTAEKLKAKGLNVSFIGETAGEPAIVAEQFKTWLNGRKVLIPSSEQSNRSIAQTLPASQVEELIIYRTVAKPLTIQPCTINVFTSPSNFLSFIQKNSLESNQTIIAWGKTTEKAIRTAGYVVNTTLTFASEEELVDVLTSRV
jgi:uroporphyrinogen-III synthase